jgi:hypothetical protein
MRARAAAVLGFASLALGAGVGACVDLFHSTSDVLTACELDPSLAGCTPEAAAAPTSDAVDVCASSPLAARQQADRACAWLGACETPMGGNAFGPCTVQARMAYDCAANPAHRAAGSALAFWTCMLGATTCAAVGACVFPAGPETCEGGGASSSCGARASATASNRSVVVTCDADGGVALGENCAMGGQTCSASAAGEATCVGPAGFACDASECAGTTIHWCPGPGASMDLGIDCADNGGGRCDTFPTRSDPQWAACTTGSAADASIACAPSAAATCDGGVATSCPSGVAETVDCATILGSAGACTTGALSPPFDWTSACAVSPPACSADACDDAGVVLTGCARGAAFLLNCAEAGLGPCGLVALDADAGSTTAAACSPSPGQP